MAAENPNDPFKDFDWKGIGGEMLKDPSASVKQIAKKRRRKFREIPEYYFLPRYSWPKTLAFSGACIAGGIGAGMLIEKWIKKKVDEDGGVIWEFDK